MSNETYPKAENDKKPFEVTQVYEGFYRNYPFVSPTPGEISIIASSPAADGDIVSATLANQLKDCGFNAAIQLLNFQKYINSTETVDFPVMPSLLFAQDWGSDDDSDPVDTTTLQQTVKNLLKKPNCAGFLFMNVPSYKNMSKTYSVINGDTTTTVNRMEKAYTDVVTSSITDDNGELTGPPKCFLVTVPGSVNQSLFTDAQGNVVSFTKYLNRFNQVFHPSCWPYVYYPVLKNASTEIEEIKYKDFFKALEIYSTLWKYTCSPMWADLKCSAGPNDAEVKAASLRFTAFNALAYGAQGFICRRYRAENSSVSAPLDVNGVKNTAVWNIVRQINKEIKAFNFVFYNAQVVKVRHTGNRLFDGAAMLKENEAFGPLASVTGCTTGTGVTLSLLGTINETVDADGNKEASMKNYLVVVNHSNTTNTPVTLNFCDYWAVTQHHYQTAINQVIPVALTNFRDLNYNIAPGGYLIFSWE